MKRSRLNRSTPEQIREWKRSAKRLQRGNSRLSRTPLSPVGRRRAKMRKEGTLFGEVFDWLFDKVGECQAKGEFPGECGRLPGRAPLEPCHALTRNAGHYDWTDDPATGERTCNALIMCPVHHDWADGHKAESLEWMRETARQNGELFNQRNE